ncbi:unnamed protein product [Haemonchus placei]|uniref:Uncharacterized protein n=1 Tax=Haemonchus placei TaxID=6290 RepID=A0A0N4X033_HAEPC|nr:unnamed protein product [Haemonchus placei]
MLKGKHYRGIHDRYKLVPVSVLRHRLRSVSPENLGLLIHGTLWQHYCKGIQGFMSSRAVRLQWRRLHHARFSNFTHIELKSELALSIFISTLFLDIAGSVHEYPSI